MIQTPSTNKKHQQMNREVFIKVATLENAFEADILKDGCEKEHIPVIVRSFHDTAYNGIYILQKGWGVILVPEEYRERAKKIISLLRETFNKKSKSSISSECFPC